MESCIGVLNIWDKHGHWVSCKRLHILEGVYHVEEIHLCIIWQHEDQSRQGHIGRTILQVEDDRSNGIRDLLGSHESAHGQQYPLAMGTDAGPVDAMEI